MLDFLNTLPGALALGLIWSVMAIGVYITYKVLNIADLTVDGSFVTGGIVAAVLITGGMNFILALLIATLAGAVCGLITGLIHTLLGIPAILAGILTQMALWSINLVISSGKSNIAVSVYSNTVIFSQGLVGDALWKGALIIGLIVTILYIFFGTELGASIRATGNNQDMARAQGINTKMNIVLGLMISNALVALSGALLAQYQGFADINMGKGAIVIGLCAVVIGTAIMSKISQNFLVRLLGCAVGGLIYYIIFQAVVFLGLDTNLLKMLAAVIVIVFLGVPYLQKTYGAKIKKHLDNRKIAKGGDQK
ncbi:MAG: ABC transporter permease [Bacilli bacterium]|nr:ABC transporter permease [Bacilli bacterium]MDY6362696.1 ABC transporter permease [Bacilli bacterium]